MTDQQCGLIGCPDDTGVFNNGGRPGSAEGPAMFRSFFQKPKGQNEVQTKVQDLGNAANYGVAVSDSHDSAAELIKQGQQTHKLSLILGGGHDYAYPHLRGIKEAIGNSTTLGCINIDPHFDLRPDQDKILSGSPFYMAVDRSIVQGPNLVEFGIQRHCNARNLWQYAADQGIKTYPFEDLRFGRSIEAYQQALNYLAQQCDAIVVSLDLDSINAAYAPGVSAPATEGFNVSEVLEMLTLSARQKEVISLGIYELNPKYDLDHHTAKLASTAAYHFLDERLNGIQ